MAATADLLRVGEKSGRLSGSDLLDISRLWASRIGGEAGSGQPVHQRWYCRLTWNEDYEVWLLGWNATLGTDFHDHGGSSGAVSVISGEVVERRIDMSTGSIDEHRLRRGDGFFFDTDVIHDVHNAGAGSSLTVHVYSPPLTRQTFYDVSNGEITPNSTVEVDGPETDGVELSIS